jgi:hypothetical protein
MTTAAAAPTPTQSPLERAQHALRDAEQPLTATQLKKALPGAKFKKNELERALEEMCDRGELHRCSPSGKTPRYWVRDEAKEIAARVERFLAAGPRSEKDIVAAVKDSLKGTQDKTIKKEVAALREQKRLHDHPKKKIGAQPPDPLATMTLNKSVVNGLRTAFEKAHKAGATVEQFLGRLRELVLSQPASASPPAPTPIVPAPSAVTEVTKPEPLFTPPAPPDDRELEELVLKAVREAGQGVPVPVADLRRQMPAEYGDKARFDRAVWRLVAQEKLYPVRHNYPASLSDAERADLLTDQEGEFYAFVAQPG